MRDGYLIFASLVFSALVSSANAGEEAVRLEVQTAAPVAVQDQALPVSVTLVDSQGQPATVPHDVAIKVIAESSDGLRREIPATVQAGGSGVQLNLEPGVEGLVTLRAESAELRPGEEVVKVLALSSPDTLAEPEFTLSPAVSDSSRRFRFFDSASFAPPAGTAAAEQPAVARALVLVTQTSDLLANGVEAATVRVYLGRIATEPLRFLFSSDRGRLDPAELEIPAGELGGQVRLTATLPGLVSVELVNPPPGVLVDGERRFTVRFFPPVARLALRASPVQVPIWGEADLIAELRNAADTTIADERNRQVRFTVDQGLGDFDPKVVEIESGKPDARVVFRPDWWGEIVVTASTPGLLQQTTTLQVDIWRVLGTTILAAGLGGLLAWATQRPRTNLLVRLLVGLSASFVLYWNLLYFGLLPRAAVTNVLGIFVISFMGAWTGPAVFDWVRGRVFGPMAGSRLPGSSPPSATAASAAAPASADLPKGGP